MATSNNVHRVTKRTSNACSRCRRQKIKCSGLQPCANCSRRNLNCIFDDRDNKVLVTQGHYLADLQQKIARLERSQLVGRSSFDERHEDQNFAEHADDRNSLEEHGRAQSTPRASPDERREAFSRREETNTESTELTNPLTAMPSKFMSSSTGRTFYLGTSSNWSFHGQILSLVHEHTRMAPLPSCELLFDGSAYDLPWDGSRSLPDSNGPLIPSIDHAIYLINAVKFHCAQLVHLFDEDEFMTNLHAFYSNEDSDMRKGTLWYIHFLLIMAFGKTFAQHKNHAPRPPGAEFFIHALQLLPDTNRLCREPVLAAEILCCIALYLQALDSRNAAHVTIGQAMRIALAHGMHTDMPVDALGEPLVQRCRKIWWTVYILDRQMTSLMGLPQSIRDEDISCRLPDFPGSAQRVAALNMQIKLAQIHAEIATTVYGLNGRLRKKFVLSIKIVLDRLAELAEELRNSFPLHSDERFSGISRTPAHLHLLYYQTIVMVTRPLLFCCLKKIFESPREVEPLISSRKIGRLLNMCAEASQNILNILESLQDQGLLETFLPWDLDALFVSTMVPLLTRFVDHSILESRSSWIDKAFEFLETMISSGNRIAEFRNRELRKLAEMLSEYSATRTQLPLASTVGQGSPNNQQLSPDATFAAGLHQANTLPPSQVPYSVYTGLSDESSGFGEDLTAAQLLAVADSMDFEGTDWLSFTTMQNCQMDDPHNV